MLSEKHIKAEAALDTTYQRGCEYFRMGLVHDLTFDRESNTFIASVLGNYYYEVIIKLNAVNDLASYQCGCEANRKYQGACKHVVAVLKKILSSWNQFYISDDRVILSGSARSFLESFSMPLSINGELEQEITLITPRFCFSIETSKKRNWLEFAIGNHRKYVMKSVLKFVEAALKKTELYYGRDFTFSPGKTQFNTQSQAIINLLKKTYIDEKDIADWSSYYTYTSSFSEEKLFKLNPSNLSDFFDIMKDNSFAVSIDGGPPKAARVVEGRPTMDISVNSLKVGLNINLEISGDVLYALDSACRYIYHKGLIYHVDEAFAQKAAPLLKYIEENKKTEIDIPDSEAHRFFSEVMPALGEIGNIKLDDALEFKYFKEPIETKIYFDRYKEGISARVLFQYGTLVINPIEIEYQIEAHAEESVLLRDTKGEQAILSLFDRFSFKQLDNRFYLLNEEDLYTFLTEGLPLIKTAAEVFYSDDFKNINIQSSNKISLGVRLNTDTDMLEMSFNLEDSNIKELMEMMSSFRLKKKYHRLKNGSFLSLENPTFKTITELIEQLDIKPSEVKGKIIELPKFRALYMDSLARETAELVMKENNAFKKLVQDVLEPQNLELEFAIPESLEGTLRDYQKTGFRWLKSLSAYGFGGILADDMGLGKTLQILAFILSESNNEKPLPSLVIAPTSLIYNWQDEVLKFAPTLKVLVISGIRKDRLERISDLKDVDLVVTSYGMMRQDIDVYRETYFRYCFVDEAQHIKNPNTLNAKSVKSIKAQGYFAITGTPIENTLTELWSIFDFIMPGYLKSRKKFEDRFEGPIVKNQDVKALQELSRHIRPFVLRRMKRDVLTELPEKIESKMVNEMKDAQKKVYTAYLLQAKKEFETEIKTNGFEKSQIKILALLTRLRQICCHPGLFIENYKGSSGKLDMLCELLENAVSSGHRVLVFSQFTSMLALIRTQVDALKLRTAYLDGSTPAKERMRLVKAFNGGEDDVFLISLKAGGTGLNLTGADMVIHYDPWWNPAVEDQATDRAYRIGQQKAVQVFKLITKDTIEEKIFELQQKKKELIDSVILSGESFISKMDEKDIRSLFGMVE